MLFAIIPTFIFFLPWYDRFFSNHLKLIISDQNITISSLFGLLKRKFDHNYKLDLDKKSNFVVFKLPKENKNREMILSETDAYKLYQFAQQNSGVLQISDEVATAMHPLAQKDSVFQMNWHEAGNQNTKDQVFNIRKTVSTGFRLFIGLHFYQNQF